MDTLTSARKPEFLLQLVATGFRHVDDKKNETCALDMELQSQRFFGRKQLAVAHSIVTDVDAFGVGAEVVRNTLERSSTVINA